MTHAIIIAIMLLSPSTSHADAQLHAEAAMDAHRQTGIDASLLLAIGYVESRFTSSAYAYRRGSHLCGPTQIATRSRATCDALRSDERLAYLTAARHLVTWRSTRVCRVRIDVELCALQGYSGGWRSIEAGSTSYARRVRLVRARIEREMSKGEVS